MSQPTEDLQANLEQATAAAAAFRDGLALPEDKAQEDLAQAASEAQVVERFLQDVEEALKQVFVAGLAYPDPELPDELTALSERAQRHGLASAMGYLLRLKAYLEATTGQSDLFLRQQHAQEAWSETQRFLAWVRLFRSEHNFITVQGKMAAEATGELRDNSARYPTRSATVWPLGIELDRGGKLLVFCQDVETGRYVLLRDQLAEFDERDPLGSRSISRLFQDAIKLSDLLESVVRLEDHPVVTRASAWLFRPAFQALPTLHPVASNFNPPPVPDLEVGEDGQLRVSRAVPSRVQGVLGLGRQGGVELRLPHNLSLRQGMTDTLRLSLTKLLLREGRVRQDVDLTVMPREEALVVLSMRTEFDGRVFPSQDPTLFRLDPSVLQARIHESTRDDAGDAGSLWLRAVALLLGGASREQAQATRAALDHHSPQGLAQAWRLGVLRHLHQSQSPIPQLEELLGACLRLVLHKEADPLDLDALALVLGRPRNDVSPGDLRFLDGQAIYQAVWLAMEFNLLDPLRDLMMAVFQAKYSGALQSPAPGDLCARALLMGLLELGHDDETYTGPTEDGTGPALSFLMAYLPEICAGRQGTRAMPLPEFIEIYQLADTWAWLEGLDRYSAIVLAAQFPPTRLILPVADALIHWSVLDRDKADQAALWEVGDAILLLMAGALRPWLVL